MADRQSGHRTASHSSTDPVAPAGDQVRLDKWLWAARFYKSRGLAADAVDSGKVQVNGERVKRAKQVHLRDEIRVRHGPYEYIVTITGIADRRGSAAAAALLYVETEESKVARVQIADHMKSMHVETRYGSGRPTKRDRRQIDEFRDKREG
jgi:ribosome-associated heat shock protein Hsp15